LTIFFLLLLKFVIWSLRGLLAGELHHSAVNIVTIYASLGAVIGGAIAIALFTHQQYGKPAYIPPDFKY
jgi:hypothetical protein